MCKGKSPAATAICRLASWLCEMHCTNLLGKIWTSPVKAGQSWHCFAGATIYYFAVVLDSSGATSWCAKVNRLLQLQFADWLHDFVIASNSNQSESAHLKLDRACFDFDQYSLCCCGLKYWKSKALDSRMLSLFWTTIFPFNIVCGTGSTHTHVYIYNIYI